MPLNLFSILFNPHNVVLSGIIVGLDITAKPVSQYNKGKKTRIADSGSIPNANTYIQSKTMKNRITSRVLLNKFVDLVA